jgi:predicted alpha/beta superfamily hydrolase
MARYKQLLFVIGASCLCFGPTPTFAAKPKVNATSESITIGTSHRLHADDLGEDRTVNVVLPSSYAKDPSRRYPVLYLIDGGVDQDLLHIAGVVHLGAIWGRSAEAIVVGIETKDRRRELVGPTQDPDLLKRYPTAGSSANFRAFIRNQVKPFVAGRYRTNGRDAVLGESLAGLFVIETYLNEPSLFGSYGAIDPSLWWDKEALSQTAMQKIGEGQKGRPLFLAVAKEQSEEPAAYQRTISALRGRQMTFCLALRPEQTHATIYQQTSPEVVQYLIPPAEAPSVFRVNCVEKIP